MKNKEQLKIIIQRTYPLTMCSRGAGHNSPSVFVSYGLLKSLFRFIKVVSLVVGSEERDLIKRIGRKNKLRGGSRSSHFRLGIGAGFLLIKEANCSGGSLRFSCGSPFPKSRLFVSNPRETITLKLVKNLAPHPYECEPY